MTRTIELTDEMLLAICFAADHIRILNGFSQASAEVKFELNRVANLLEDIQIAALKCTQTEVIG